MFCGDINELSGEERMQILLDSMKGNYDVEVLQECYMNEISRLLKEDSKMNFVLDRKGGMDIITHCMTKYETNKTLVTSASNIIFSLCATNNDALLATVARVGGVKMIMKTLAQSGSISDETLIGCLNLLKGMFKSRESVSARSSFDAQNGIKLVLNRIIPSGKFVDEALELIDMVLGNSASRLASVPKAVMNEQGAFELYCNVLFRESEKKSPSYLCAQRMILALAEQPFSQIPSRVFVEYKPFCSLLKIMHDDLPAVQWLLRGIHRYVEEHSRQRVSIVYDEELYDLLAQAMMQFSDDEGVTTLGCEIISLLAPVDSRTALLLKSNCLEALVLGLNTFMKVQPIMRFALKALMHISFSEEGKKFITNVGGLKIMLNVLNEYEVDCAGTEDACSILWNLVTNCTGNQKEIIKLDITPVIKFLRASEVPKVVQACCAILGNTASACPENKTVLGDMGCIDIICDAMKKSKFIYESQVQQGASLALLNFVLNHKENLQRCSKDDIVSALIASLKNCSFGSAVIPSLLRVIAQVSQFPNVVILIHSLGGPQILMTLLRQRRHHGDKAIMIPLTNCILNLAIYPPSRNVFLTQNAMYLVCREWREIRGEPKMQKYAPLALAEMASVGVLPFPPGELVRFVELELGSHSKSDEMAFCWSCLLREADFRLVDWPADKCTSLVLPPCPSENPEDRHRFCKKCCMVQPCFFCVTCFAKAPRSRLCKACYKARHADHEVITMFEAICCTCTDPKCPCHAQ